MAADSTVHEMPIFAGLGEQEKDALIASGHVRRLVDGETLFSHGDKVAHVHLILSGTVQLSRVTPEGRLKTVALLGAGQSLGEEEIMDACAGHRTSATAIGEVSALVFPAGWLKQAARRHPDIALNLLSMIAERAESAQLEAEHQASMSAAQLLACFLQRLCVLHELDPHGFELPYSKALIASRLGMEPETFSRAANKLSEHGIHIEGNHVTIHDLQRIAGYVCAFCSVSEDCTTHQSLDATMKKLAD